MPFVTRLSIGPAESGRNKMIALSNTKVGENGGASRNVARGDNIFDVLKVSAKGLLGISLLINGLGVAWFPVTEVSCGGINDAAAVHLIQVYASNYQPFECIRPVHSGNGVWTNKSYYRSMAINTLLGFWE